MALETHLIAEREWLNLGHCCQLNLRRRMTGFANTGQSASARVLLKAEIQQPTPYRSLVV
jgi:hypothetical protein